MAGTKGLGREAGSAAADVSGFAVTEAGALPKAEGCGAFTASRGGQTGCTLSATFAVERHSVFQAGRAGSAGFTGGGLNTGCTSALGGCGVKTGLTGAEGAAAGFAPCSR